MMGGKLICGGRVNGKRCFGTMFKKPLSKAEDLLGHTAYECEKCHAVDKHVPDRDQCEHPNVQYEPDVWENGVRVSKHHWWCPDCDFVQVG